jgi:hypothetical protein
LNWWLFAVRSMFASNLTLQVGLLAKLTPEQIWLPAAVWGRRDSRGPIDRGGGDDRVDRIERWLRLLLVGQLRAWSRLWNMDLPGRCVRNRSGNHGLWGRIFVPDRQRQLQRDVERALHPGNRIPRLRIWGRPGAREAFGELWKR